MGPGRRCLRFAVTLVTAAAAVGCSVPLPVGEPGVVAMMPYVNVEMGIGGVAPVGCQASPDQLGLYICEELVPGGPPAVVQQQAAPVPLKELWAALDEAISPGMPDFRCRLSTFCVMRYFSRPSSISFTKAWWAGFGSIRCHGFFDGFRLIPLSRRVHTPSGPR